jgi:hypothetical protein
MNYVGVVIDFEKERTRNGISDLSYYSLFRPVYYNDSSALPGPVHNL